MDAKRTTPRHNIIKTPNVREDLKSSKKKAVKLPTVEFLLTVS